MEPFSGQPMYKSNQKINQLIQKLVKSVSDLKAKEEQGKRNLTTEIQKLEEFLQYVPKGSDDINNAEVTKLRQHVMKKKEECELHLKEMEKKKKQVQDEKQKMAKVATELEEQHANFEKMYPKVRYSVNLYRDITHIKWQSSTESSEVSGYINTKSGLKTFRFDKSKQSQFFITNSLWDMGDET